MPLDERRKCQLGSLTTPGREPFQKLTVGQVPDAPRLNTVRNCRSRAPFARIATSVPPSKLRPPVFVHDSKGA